MEIASFTLLTKKALMHWETYLFIPIIEIQATFFVFFFLLLAMMQRPVAVVPTNKYQPEIPSLSNWVFPLNIHNLIQLSASEVD